MLMRRDVPLAEKASVAPGDLLEKPLILTDQPDDAQLLTRWLSPAGGAPHVVATYNLVFNASLLVDEGLGYALCLDRLINTDGSRLCFRPLSPPLESAASLVWKKYPAFSKAARTFLSCLRGLL